MTRTPIRPRTVLCLESLEGRDAPATLVGPTKVTYQDTDGDNVTVLFTKPILNAGNVNSVFTFDTGTVDGSNSTKQQLRSINLTGIALAAGTTISVSAVRSPVTGGDGFAAVGQVNATGIDLGAVTIDGDLGRILAGDATTTTSGMAGLTARSMGRYRTTTGAPDLFTTIQGKLGFLKVKSDLIEASVAVHGGPDGKIGSVFVGGSLIGGIGTGSGGIFPEGDLGFVTIVGNMTGASGLGSGSVLGGGKLAGAKVGGSVRGGIGDASGAIKSGGAMGFVNIVGNLIGGAGITSGEVSTSAKVVGVRVGGSLQGGTGVQSGRIVTGETGSITIGGDVVGGSATGTTSLNQSGMIIAGRVAKLTLGGSLIAGTDNTTGFFQENGAIRINNDVGAMLIKGSIIGNTTNPAIISARGKATPTATTDVAIGSLRVLGRVEFGQILAGYLTGNIAANADAQIGTVSVGGDWIASSIAAGALAGADGFFGNADDVKMSGMGIKDDSLVFSKIGSLTIGGQVLGTIGGIDHFGFVAEIIGAVKVGGTPLSLSAGKSNDDFLVGITGDLKVNEI